MNNDLFDNLDGETLVVTTPPAAVAAPKERRYDIIIDEVEGLPGFEYVGVNGEGFQIKRGEPVSVPEKVINALKNAITVAYRKVPDPRDGSRNILVPYNRSTIPWRLA
jgi:hypothetical protein